MSELEIFDFNGAQVRTVLIDGNPWWVAKDVCDVLEISNPSDVMTRLDEADLGTTEVRSGGQNRKMNMVNESGLYDLILDSRKPQAKAFRKWITAEVVPSIRKTGSYVAAPATQLDILAAAVATLQEQERRTQALEVETKAISAKVAAIEGAHNWFTALGYAINNNYPTDRRSLMSVGKRASAIMRARGVKPVPRQDATFGQVNTYPVDVLEEAFKTEDN